MFSGHTGGLKHVLFMKDGKQMLSCAEDKTIRVWDKASGKVRLIQWAYFAVIYECFLSLFQSYIYEFAYCQFLFDMYLCISYLFVY